MLCPDGRCPCQMRLMVHLSHPEYLSGRLFLPYFLPYFLPALSLTLARKSRASSELYTTNHETMIGASAAPQVNLAHSGRVSIHYGGIGRRRSSALVIVIAFIAANRGTEKRWHVLPTRRGRWQHANLNELH